MSSVEGKTPRTRMSTTGRMKEKTKGFPFQKRDAGKMGGTQNVVAPVRPQSIVS